MIILTNRRSVVLSAVALLVVYFGACADTLAVGFSPFGTAESEEIPSASNVVDEGPVIPDIQFSDHDITKTFQIISDLTGWSIFSTAKVKLAKVTLSAKDVTAKELLDRIVTLAGFIYHRKGNEISVVTYEEYAQFYGLSRKVIGLKYADAGSIDAVIKQFLTALGKSVVHEATNTIVLYEVEANLVSISGIIEKLDTPAEDIGIEVINLKYADCESLASLLQQVFTGKAQMTRNRGGQAESTVSPAPGPGKRITPTKPAVAKEVPVAYEEVGIYGVVHSNQLIVVGTESDIRKVKDVVNIIDVYGDSMVLEVVDLKYADAEMVARTLQEVFAQRQSKEAVTSTQQGAKSTGASRPPPEVAPAAGTADIFFTPQAHVEVYALGRTNQLIVKAYRSDLGKLKELVKKLDVFVEPTTKNYHFVYVDAAEVYQGLEQILDIYSRYGGSYQQGGQAGVRGTGKESGLTLVLRTNSIMLTGPPSAHRIMESIRESVDVPGVYEAGMIKVYKIENGDVEEIAKTVQILVERRDEREKKPGEAKFGEAGEGAPPATGPEPTPAEMAATEEFVPQIEGKVSVNKATNSIVVQATARQHRQIEQLIKELDVRRKQVLIKAMIIEVTTSDDMDFGVELDYFKGDVLSFTSFGLSQIDTTTGVREIIVSPGGTAAVLRPNKVQAIVNALASNDNIRIESAPQILVNDNAIGAIQSIAEEPTKQTNLGETTTTTSFGEFVQAGTQFAITPHISDGNYLRVEYTITLSSFGEKADPELPPARSTSTIQSEATVPDGSTIVVGGIQASNETESVDKVPLLGDIPLIGLAFRNTIIRKQYLTTYLFITTSIMRSEEFGDLRAVSKAALEEVNKNGRGQTPEPENEETE